MLCALLGLIVGFCFLLLLQIPVNTAVFSMGKKFYPVNRNLINLIKINVSQMTLGPAGYHRLQMLKCSIGMTAVFYLHVSEFQDQPIT